MELPNLMPTLSHVFNKLVKKGIDKDFKWEKKGFTIDGKKSYLPGQLAIIKVFRFEELKDPSDTCVLYILESEDGTQGYILDAYGAYSCHDEEGFDNAFRLVPLKDRNDQLLFEL